MLSMMSSHHCLTLLAISLSISGADCFSAAPPSSSSNANGNAIGRIKSIILDQADTDQQQQYDATTVPIEQILSTPGILIPSSSSSSTTATVKLSHSSDFYTSAGYESILLPAYTKSTRDQHNDCIHLFDNYTTTILRCQVLDESSLNIRWNAMWIPPGSTWLYNLAEVAKWNVTKKCPDSSIVATFSWRSVLDLFQRAFSTGEITLPISMVEGNTVLTLSYHNTIEEEKVGSTSKSKEAEAASTIVLISLKESIDLVAEADKDRLQNRRVAQELASWIDVSRRPTITPTTIRKNTKDNIINDSRMDADEWAGIVRQRVLSGVTGAGPLDVDPNEDEAEGVMALLIFGIMTLSAIAISLQLFLIPELVGGTGSIPETCDDAELLEFGSGYLSECFGLFGDPTL